MKTFYKCFTILSSLFFIGDFAYAQDFGSVGGILNSATTVASEKILVILVAIGLILFIVGVIRMMRNADSPEEIKKWKNIFIWGIIALFLMFSVIGVLSVLTRSTTGGNPILPLLPTSVTQ